MKKNALLLTLTWASLLPLHGQAPQTPAPVPAHRIITDDVMMLTTAAAGLEALACCPYPRTRTVQVAAGSQARIDWADGRRYGRDTLWVIRIEIVKADVLVA